MKQQLIWICEICQFPIADEAGYLTVDLDHVSEVENARREWKAENPLGAPLDALMRYPDPVHWQTVHRDCDPNLEANSYWYDVQRLRSHSELLARTAHLMGKRWLSFTDWDEIIEFKAGE